MSGLAMPGGDPGGLEQLASTLEAAARGFGELGRSTRQVSTPFGQMRSGPAMPPIPTPHSPAI